MLKLIFFSIALLLVPIRTAPGAIVMASYSFEVGGFMPAGGPETVISGSFTTTFVTVAG